MKYLSILSFSICIILCGCEKIIPDLPRDNKADSAFSGYDSEKIRILDYYSSNVACRYPKGSDRYMEDNIIKAGDRVYLNVYLKNNCNHNIEVIRATFSCDESYIHVIQPENGYFVKFADGSSYIDNVPAWETGWGEITNGTYYHFAPNYNSYAVEFTVDTNVVSESVFQVKMNLTDKFNNSWDRLIPLTIK